MDPVLCTDGHTYERRAIEAWCARILYSGRRWCIGSCRFVVRTWACVRSVPAGNVGLWGAVLLLSWLALLGLAT